MNRRRRIHDLTLPITPGLTPWPGDPSPVVSRVRSIAAGDSCNVSRLDVGVHCGTHVDAPCHFIEGAPAVEAMPLDILTGPAGVVVLEEAAAIDAPDLEALDLPPGLERVLIRTRNSGLWETSSHAFRTDYVALTAAAARWLVERGIRLVGVDYLSVERFREPGHPVHMILLGAGVVVVEGLDLRGIAAGSYELVCLPLKIVGSDGAPTRVILIEEERY